MMTPHKANFIIPRNVKGKQTETYKSKQPKTKEPHVTPYGNKYWAP